MDIIKRNLFKLLRSGAFNKFEAIEPMSKFKWNRLLQMATIQGIAPVVLKGIKAHQYENKVNFPQSFMHELATTVEKPIDPVNLPRLSNIILNHRLKRIRKAERHTIDTSTETVELLNIIVGNVSGMLNNGVSLRGIIDLGKHLRTMGDKVDFVKLDSWLERLRIKRMAQLEGSVLISVFDFDKDEVPFVARIEPHATLLTVRSVNHTAIDSAKEWHFRQGRGGLVRNNSAALRRSLRRGVRYVNYAPIETVSNLIRNFARSLSEIEE